MQYSYNIYTLKWPLNNYLGLLPVSNHIEDGSKTSTYRHEKQYIIYQDLLLVGIVRANAVMKVLINYLD